MEITVFENPELLADAVADFILNLVIKKPNATIVLTSGDTPKLAYQILAQKASAKMFENTTIIGLDEWVGISAENSGSCSYIVIENLLKPLGLPATNYTFFDAMASDLEKECSRIDELIAKNGGLDLMLVGLGLNGHIGLNEPGASFDSYCHVTELADLTVRVGQKYFNNATSLEKGITVGLKHLRDAKVAMLIATGNKKSEAVNNMINGMVTEDFPASIFQTLENGLVWIDKSCDSKI